MTRLGLVGLLLLMPYAFAQHLTKLIPLHHVSASQVIPLLQPVLQPKEKLNGSANTLIVQASPETLTRLRGLIHQLDLPPAMLNVSVYQSSHSSNPQETEHQFHYETVSSRSTFERQSINVLSGKSALVAINKEVPIISAVATGFFTSIAYQQKVIKNGFWIQPVLQGKQIKLAIKDLKEQADPTGGQQFNKGKIATTVIIPLNQWVALNTMGAGPESDAPTIIYSAGRSVAQQSTIYIKVTVISP